MYAIISSEDFLITSTWRQKSIGGDSASSMAKIAELYPTIMQLGGQYPSLNRKLLNIMNCQLPESQKGFSLFFY